MSKAVRINRMHPPKDYHKWAGADFSKQSKNYEKRPSYNTSRSKSTKFIGKPFSIPRKSNNHSSTNQDGVFSTYKHEHEYYVNNRDSFNVEQLKALQKRDARFDAIWQKKVWKKKKRTTKLPPLIPVVRPPWARQQDSRPRKMRQSVPLPELKPVYQKNFIAMNRKNAFKTRKRTRGNKSK